MTSPDRSRCRVTLQQASYFASLDAATLDELVSLATWHEYAPGALIFLEGETGSGLYAMHSGWVKVIKLSPDGREHVLRFIGPDEIFNEIGIFLARPNPATAVALEQAGIWQLHRRALQPVLLRHPDVMLQIMASMANRIAFLAETVANLSLHSVEVRLARLLLDSAPDGALVRQSWLTQTELAAHLGTVPDVLSRALRTLADARLIHVERRQITILDRTGLAARAIVEE